MRRTPGRLKSALTGGLRGIAQGLATGQGLAGAVGGGIGGAIGGAADPTGLREQQFNQDVRPKLQERFTLEDEERDRAVRQRIEEAQLARIPREAAMDEARLRQIGVQNEVALENARGQRELRESQVKLNTARTEAARTGRPQRVDRVNDNGQIETVMVYPNGDEWIVGGSAQAAINKQNIKSREGIAAMREAGATGRAAMAQSGQNTRQAERLAAQGEGGASAGGSKLRKPSTTGGASSEQIQRIIAEAKKRGKNVTEAEVRARLKARGQ